MVTAAVCETLRALRERAKVQLTRASVPPLAVMGWLISVGWCFLIIEPIQIVFVSMLPFVITQDSRCGQCIEWARWAYNEYFAP